MRKFLIIAGYVVCIIGIFWLFGQLRSVSKEYKQLYDIHQTTLADGKDAPLVIIDTIIDTVYNTAGFLYNPTQTSGRIEGYVSKGFADTLAQALGVATKQIDRLQSQLVSISGQGKGERVTDTVTKIEWLTMRDPVFDIRVNLQNDSIYPTAKIRLDQAYAPYRKNIFSPWEYRSVIRASDQRVQISEIRDVTRVPKASRWGIGFGAGPVVTPQNISYGIMFGVTYDLIQK